MAQLNDLLVTGNSRFLNEINGQIDWSNVLSKPTIPAAANNGTLTIQKNGTNVQTFTANQSTNATANITVPTKVSELTNDSGYTTNTGTVTQVKVGSTAYNPTSGVVSLPAYPTNTDEKVTQTATSTNADYEVLFSGTADNTTRTEGARKNNGLVYNPSDGTLKIKRSIYVSTPGDSGLPSDKMGMGYYTVDDVHDLQFGIDPGTLLLTGGVYSDGMIPNPGDIDQFPSIRLIDNITGYDKELTIDTSDITLSGTNNTWDGTNTSLKSALANIIDLMYPIGSIYMSLTDSTTAAVQNRFGGTWEKIEGKFLLAASSSYSVNSTGGSADAVVVSHTHPLNGTNAKTSDQAAHTHPLNGTNAKAVDVGGHTHTEYAGINEATSGLFTSITGTRSYPNTHIIGGSGKTSSNGGHGHSLTGNTSTGGAHSHTLSGNTGAASDGVSGTGKNMPPYLTVYMYKRTA